MKKHSLQLVMMIAVFVVALSSCQSFGGGGRKFETTDGVADLVSGLKGEFGKDAYYTEISFNYHKSTGTTISATGTKDPESKKMISKQKMKGAWEDLSEISLEITGDAKAAEFMYTLKEVDEFKKVPGMIKTSIDKIKKEKNFDVVPTSVSVIAPDELKGQPQKLRYLLYFQPESGGTKFTMIFDQEGNFTKMLF